MAKEYTLEYKNMYCHGKKVIPRHGAFVFKLNEYLFIYRDLKIILSYLEITNVKCNCALQPNPNHICDGVACSRGICRPAHFQLPYIGCDLTHYLVCQNKNDKIGNSPYW